MLLQLLMEAKQSLVMFVNNNKQRPTLMAKSILIEELRLENINFFFFFFDYHSLLKWTMKLWNFTTDKQ